MSRGISGFIALLLATLAFSIKPVSLAEAQDYNMPVFAPNSPDSPPTVSGGGQAAPVAGSGHVTRVSVPGAEELAAPPGSVSTDSGAKKLRLSLKWKGQRGDWEIVTEAGAGEEPKETFKRHAEAVRHAQDFDPPVSTP